MYEEENNHIDIKQSKTEQEKFVKHVCLHDSLFDIQRWTEDNNKMKYPP